MMIGARGGGGGDPRLEIFASEAQEFFSSVRAILGEGDATEAGLHVWGLGHRVRSTVGLCRAE